MFASIDLAREVLNKLIKDCNNETKRALAAVLEYLAQQRADFD